MSLLTAFSNQCQLNPEQIALTQGDRQLSYNQLQALAGKVSFFLRTQGDCQRVAIALDRGIDATIALLGIVSAGACYVPLDIKNPLARLQFIASDADVQYVIGQGDCPAWLGPTQQWLEIKELVESTYTGELNTEFKRSTLAAIIYTSGSTGAPKGVALSHGAMFNFAHWAGVTFAINSQDRIASLAPFYFDLSVFDLFTSLSFGASIYFIPAQLTLMPSRLSLWLAENRISCWYTVPSILSFLAYKGDLINTPLTHLRTILFAGEVFPTEQLIRLVTQLGHVDFYNLYGPTETNVCSYWPVDRTRLQSDQHIPIGQSACDAKLRIDQESGELWVQSNNNLSGYWQAGQLQPNPSLDNWYSTGDKVTINDMAEFCYHGRLDRMLKCAGYRVEPAEIEAVIQNQEGVEHCAVIGLDDISNGQRPAAAVVLSMHSNPVEIRKAINQALPRYMQPSKFLILDALPTLSNGKIDYQVLEQLMVQQ